MENETNTDAEESIGFDTKEELIAFLKDNFGEDIDIDDLTESLNELTSDEKKLIDKMYDKKGKLTPLGKKVMNHGKKPGDKGYIEEATEIYKNKDLSVKRWTMGFDSKGNRISGFAIYGGKIGRISAKDNLVQLTKPQIQQLAKDMKKILSYIDVADELDENKTVDEGLRHIKTANFRKATKLFNDIMAHFKLGGRLNKELEDASDGELNKKYDEMYKHLRMAGEIFDDLEADVKFLESVEPSNDSAELEENKEVERITKIAKSLKVGDKTTFGVVLKIGKDSITFKNRDTPKTTIKFNQRKSGGRYVLSLLTLAEEKKVKETRFTTNHKSDPLIEAAKNVLKGS